MMDSKAFGESVLGLLVQSTFQGHEIDTVLAFRETAQAIASGKLLLAVPKEEQAE